MDKLDPTKIRAQLMELVCQGQEGHAWDGRTPKLINSITGQYLARCNKCRRDVPIYEDDVFTQTPLPLDQCQDDVPDPKATPASPHWMKGWP